MRTTNNVKKSRIYKDIKAIFNRLFGSANYRDHIINGVSFKWYITSYMKNRIGMGNVNACSFNLIRKKVLSHLETDEEFKKHSIIFEIKIVPRIYSYGYDSLRILTRFC
jgi:hypothetical protein